jgi:phenylalanine-4-hydroxylase
VVPAYDHAFTFPNRIGFDLLRIMRTRYKIDTFQETYFVIRDFRELFDATAPDFTPYYAAMHGRQPHAPRAVLPTDRVLQRGLGAGVKQ